MDKVGGMKSSGITRHLFLGRAPPPNIGEHRKGSMLASAAIIHSTSTWKPSTSRWREERTRFRGWACPHPESKNAPSLRGALATKQSILGYQEDGLLRFARNDGVTDDDS
jgi:hypothetical protein